MPAAEHPGAAAEFFRRAGQEAERYGGDPLIFLRELVQNSRDAGAGTIAFETAHDGDDFVLSCTDDGQGMSQADVERYLFRLYSSSKGQGRAGRFGVGFWSVLRFSPHTIRIESRSATAQVAFEVDVSRGAVTLLPPPRLAHTGTRITLRRAYDPALCDDERLRHTLTVSAGAVTALPPRRRPQLRFNQAAVNRPLAPRGVYARRVKTPRCNGFVGVGPQPSIRLYSFGLFVREAKSLDELLPHRAGLEGPTLGLFPVADINADGLDVLLDRSRLGEDKVLHDVVEVVTRRAAAARLEVLHEVAPLPLATRVALWAKSQGTSRVVLFAGGLLLALVLTVALASRFRVAPGGASAAPPGAVTDNGDDDDVTAPPREVRAPRPVDDAVDPLAGPVINPPEGPAAGWDITYEGPDRPFFKTATLARYDRMRGLVGEPPSDEGPYRFLKAGTDPVYIVRLGVVPSRRPLVLPVPSGHRVIAQSLAYTGEGALRLRRTPHDEPLLERGGLSAGVLTYRTAPGGRVPVEAGLREGPARVGGPFARVLRKVRKQRSERRVAAIIDAVKQHVRYTTDPLDAALFARSARPFVQRVTDLGIGDCDVMNGMTVLLLRRANIPARLGVGFVGEAGEVASDLHAWTEYHLGGVWRTVDVSPPQFMPTVPSTPVGRAGPAPGGDDDDVRGEDGPGTGAEPDDGSVPGPAETIAPEAPGGHDSMIVYLSKQTVWGIGLGLLVLLGAGGWWLGRRRAPGGAGLDDCAVALMDQALSGAETGLALRRRPFFLALSGKRLSLEQLVDIAATRDLVCAAPGDDLAARVEGPVLDVSDPRLAPLLPRLPATLDLARAPQLRGQGPAPAVLGRVEARLRPAFGPVSLNLAPGAGVSGYAVVVDGAPTHVVVLGHDHPTVRAALASDDDVTLLDTVLTHTTLALADRAGWRAHFLREALS